MAAGVKEPNKPLTSLQIEVPNDLQEQEEGAIDDADVPMEEDNELEEGEASEDEVEVNVIIREDVSAPQGPAPPQRSPSPPRSPDYGPRNDYPVSISIRENTGGFMTKFAN